jgi:hypothetical protein
MMNLKERWRTVVNSAEKPLALGFLICLHIIICCASLVCVSYFKYAGYFDAAPFHIFYDPARLLNASAVIVIFALVSILFVFARFSFGYFIGFYLYTMVLGYLWINCFSDLNYDHWLGGLSAAASALAFLVPALLIISPIRQVYVLSPTSFERLLALTLLIALATIVSGAIYNFRLVAVENIYHFRSQLQFPKITAYLIGITSSVLLPFAFACFFAKRAYWRAGAVLLLALMFYPITLSKLTLFTPAWLVVIAVLTRIFGARMSVILSLFLPMLLGVLIVILKTLPSYFYIVNIRMMAVPSVAMDIYNHYFSDHDFTYFCQIRVLKPLISCRYEDQLSVFMQEAYGLGYFNASLFATEGIASVGLVFAPISAFVCGLVMAIANRLSAGLPPHFIMISSAVIPQILLNVPLSTTLVTHGGVILLLLWYLTPRTIFEENKRST